MDFIIKKMAKFVLNALINVKVALIQLITV